MTEKQAWLTLGRAYGTRRSARTQAQENLTSDGICQAFMDGLDLSYTTQRSMQNKIYGVIKNRDNKWWNYFCSPHVPANDLLRADYCWLQYYRLGGMKDE